MLFVRWFGGFSFVFQSSNYPRVDIGFLVDLVLWEDTYGNFRKYHTLMWILSTEFRSSRVYNLYLYIICFSILTFCYQRVRFSVSHIGQCFQFNNGCLTCIIFKVFFVVRCCIAFIWIGIRTAIIAAAGNVSCHRYWNKRNKSWLLLD